LNLTARGFLRYAPPGFPYPSFLGAELSVMTGGLIILSIVAVLLLCFPYVRQFQMAQAREAVAPR
jgi:hypothetical protein